jgi:L-malate glycosyltransferase
MISYQTINDHVAQYRKLHIPEEYANKIEYIQNGIVLPDELSLHKENKNLVVLYVGRGSAEKRVHLVAQIAKRLKDLRSSVEVQFLGDVKEAIPQSLHSYAHFWGSQNDPATIQKIYAGADVLILTSVFEGFPMVAMEAMAQGLTIVSTAVGDIPYHIKDEENGFLIHEKDEEAIVEKGAAILSNLSNNRSVLEAIGQRNKNYAFERFGIEAFNKNYLRLFESLEQYE